MGLINKGPVGDVLRRMEASLEKEEIFWSEDVERDIAAYLRDKLMRLKVAASTMQKIDGYYESS